MSLDSRKDLGPSSPSKDALARETQSIGDPEGSDATSPGKNGQIPNSIGGYRIIKEIGSGAAGRVFLGLDPNIQQNVAIKLIPLDFRMKPVDSAKQRFYQEVKIAHQLNHPSIIRIYRYGEDDLGLYIIMEYAAHGDLEALLEKKGKMEVADAITVVKSIASALVEAGKRNIVHRDIKPKNIVVTEDGRFKLTDLGIAKYLNQETGLSITSGSKGTPYYMPPEQIADAKHVDCRADIYSLGVTFYEMITGMRPFSGKNQFEIWKKIETGEFKRPHLVDPSLDTGICDIIYKMMALKPDDRFQSAQKLIDELEMYESGPLNLISKETNQGTDTISECWTKETLDKPHKQQGSVLKVSLMLLLLAGVVSIVAIYRKIPIMEPAAVDEKESPISQALISDPGTKDFDSQSIPQQKEKVSRPQTNLSSEKKEGAEPSEFFATEQLPELGNSSDYDKTDYWTSTPRMINYELVNVDSMDLTLFKKIQNILISILKEKHIAVPDRRKMPNAHEREAGLGEKIGFDERMPLREGNLIPVHHELEFRVENGASENSWLRIVMDGRNVETSQELLGFEETIEVDHDYDALRLKLEKIILDYFSQTSLGETLLRGRLIHISSDGLHVLINIGKFHGVEIDQEFQICKKIDRNVNGQIRPNCGLTQTIGTVSETEDAVSWLELQNPINGLAADEFLVRKLESKQR